MPAKQFSLAILVLATAACSSRHATAPDGGHATGIAWIAPTTNADGTPLKDLAGYKLHYDAAGRGGDAGHVYTHVVDIGMPSCSPLPAGGTECQFDPKDLIGPAGATLYMAVTAYDTATPPNESAYSNEVSFPQ
jgi:hypothetical protein